MKGFLENFNKNLPKIILALLGVVILFYLAILFVSDFNLLKVLIFLGVVLLLSILGLFVYLLKIPKEEKISFFTLFQNLLDHLNEGIVIYDYDFRIVFANKVFSEMVNLKKDDLTGLVVNQNLIKNEKYEILANLFFPFLQGENIKIVNQEPEIIEVKFSKPKEQYFLISYFDIFLDQPYKLRTVLDKTKDALESQQRIEYVRLVSHNLLTPLNQLRWLLESINLQGSHEENQELIDSAKSIIKNTLVLIEAALVFVRAELGQLKLKIEEFDLEQTILDILGALREEINRRKISVNIEVVKGEEKALGDKGLIAAALFTLLENAVFYNKTGGSIFINIRRQPQRQYREIVIKDTGIGMSQEDLKNLFKKYYRGKRAKDLNIKGLGIGLYNAKTIIDVHGGSLKVESEEDKGTTITVLLPLDINLIPQ